MADFQLVLMSLLLVAGKRKNDANDIKYPSLASAFSHFSCRSSVVIATSMKTRHEDSLQEHLSLCLKNLQVCAGDYLQERLRLTYVRNVGKTGYLNSMN